MSEIKHVHLLIPKPLWVRAKLVLTQQDTTLTAWVIQQLEATFGRTPTRTLGQHHPATPLEHTRKE